MCVLLFDGNVVGWSFFFLVLADLRGVFNWNVAQLYVWVDATYSDANGEIHSIVLWDEIILASQKDRAVISRKGISNEYDLLSRKPDLRGKELTVQFKYDVTPYSGFFDVETLGEATTFTLPNEYVKRNANWVGRGY